MLAEIDRVCRLQNVPATSSLAEYGPGQYEVNLAHAPDALRVCDEALRFKRIVKSVARSARLRGDLPAQALSRHGGQRPACAREPARCRRPQHFRRRGSARQRAAAPRHRRHAGDARRRHGAVRAGTEFLPAFPQPRPMCRCMPPGRSTIAARRSACRPRIRPTCASNIAWPVPMPIPIWSSRGCSRESTMASRIELEPPPVTTGNAYEQPGDPLPIHWSEAIERFARSEFAAHFLRRKVREPVRHRQAR